jgi:23S rRNA (cytidine1920-2'-O)/16S rRNA (cytidine1409-2'-O)-methyltransferase
VPHLVQGGWFLPLVKPQFEAGRGQVGKGGIVRDEAVRQDAIERTVAGLEALGLRRERVMDSPIAGAEGNREALALLRRTDG